jgi:hypothetical protein
MSRHFSISLLLLCLVAGCDNSAAVGDPHGDAGSDDLSTAGSDGSTTDGAVDPGRGSWTLVEGAPSQLDLLFVIDNSGSTESLQALLLAELNRSIKPLKASGVRDFRIGVVSTDLGAGAEELDRCPVNGDQGRLQNTARVAGCTPPDDPWIAYLDGQTNIPAGDEDPLARVQEAFACIAKLGSDGCGFEQPLEAARRALDPDANVNPGFRRPNAALAVVIVTNEDDCSGTDVLFAKETGELGPLNSYRCFRYGVACDQPVDRPGYKENCRPAGELLHPVQRYVAFFQQLAPEGRWVVAVLSGPAGPLTVSENEQSLWLQPSCLSGWAEAAPAVRLPALVDALGEGGLIGSLCSDDLGELLARAVDRLVPSEGPACVERPLLTAQGGLACQQGDVIGSQTCGASCLERADCTVEQIRFAPGGAETRETIPPCGAELFHRGDGTCGARCPCWRLSRTDGCGPTKGTTPHAIELLRDGAAPSDTLVRVDCRAAAATWVSPEVVALPQCS